MCIHLAWCPEGRLLPGPRGKLSGHPETRWVVPGWGVVFGTSRPLTNQRLRGMEPCSGRATVFKGPGPQCRGPIAMLVRGQEKTRPLTTPRSRHHEGTVPRPQGSPEPHCVISASPLFGGFSKSSRSGAQGGRCTCSGLPSRPCGARRFAGKGDPRDSAPSPPEAATAHGPRKTLQNVLPFPPPPPGRRPFSAHPSHSLCSSLWGPRSRPPSQSLQPFHCNREESMLITSNLTSLVPSASPRRRSPSSGPLGVCTEHGVARASGSSPCSSSLPSGSPRSEQEVPSAPCCPVFTCA